MRDYDSWAAEVVRETGKPLLEIDSSPAMREIARERAAGLPLERRLADVRDLELDEPSFGDEPLEFVYVARKP